MAATLSLDTITSSGSTITVPTGKTLAIADAGALTLGTPPIAITTGAHVTAVSALNPLNITSGNVLGKSNYVVSYNASSGTSTAFVVNLPAPTDFSTTVISVVSSTAHGLGNSIVIKDSGGTEVYTLFHQGDHCQFVSDGTNTLRSGNEYCTIRGEVAITASLYMGATSRSDTFAGSTSSNYTVLTDLGSGWSTTNDDYTAPFAGIYRFGGTVSPSTAVYISGWQIYNVTTTTEYNFVGTSINMAYGSMNVNEFPVQLAKDDVLTFWCTNHSSAGYVTGAAGANDQRSKLAWWLERRI